MCIRDSIVGVDSLFMRRQVYFAVVLSESTAGGLLINSLYVVPTFVSAIFSIAICRVKYNKGLLKPQHISIAFLAITTCLIISNPIRNPRYWFGAVVLTLLTLLFFKSVRKIWFGHLVVLALIFIFPYMDYFRRGASGVLVNSGNLTEHFRDEYLTHGDFDSFQQILNSILVVSENGFLWLKNILGAAFFMVPRGLWTGKPEPTGAIIAESLSYDFSILSAPLPAEAYMGLGWVGLIILPAAYIGVIMLLSKKLLQLPYSFNTFTLFATFMTWYQLMLLRGSLMSGIAYCTQVLFFMWLFMFILTIKKRLTRFV